MSINSEVLDSPAQVYATVFRAGVQKRAVVEAAQRFYQYKQGKIEAPRPLVVPSVDELSNLIRSIPNWHGMGAGALAESIIHAIEQQRR